MTMAHDNKPSLEDYILEHYGVKGMKWGVRRSQAALDRASGRKTAKGEKSKSKKEKPKKTSRRAAKKEAVQKRAFDLMDSAGKNPTKLYVVRTQRGDVVATGKEFTDYIKAGGAFDVKASGAWEHQLSNSEPWKK